MRCLALVAFAAVVTAPLSGCATPEDLAVIEKRQERQTQTGSNIVRRDNGARTSTVTDKDAQDALLKEMRTVPVQPVGTQSVGR
jgi:outer membrane protein assembly factor BamE (lipoprotein component of BamABCDE complex)